MIKNNKVEEQMILDNIPLIYMCIKNLHLYYQLKEQLQQSEEVIEECKQSIENFMTHIDDGFCADMMTFIDILNKYKKRGE